MNKEPTEDHNRTNNAANAGVCIALSTDGRNVATGGWGNSVYIWDLDHPEDQPTQLHGHNDAVTSICFHPARRELVTASGDGMVRLWSLCGEFEGSVELTVHERGAVKLAITPDGKRVASLGGDGTVVLSTLSTVDLADMATRKVRRNLTREEWNRYVGKDFPHEEIVPQFR